MPDIAICTNATCTMKESCYRFMADPSDFRQAYADFEQDENGECPYLIKIIIDNKNNHDKEM